MRSACPRPLPLGDHPAVPRRAHGCRSVRLGLGRPGPRVDRQGGVCRGRRVERDLRRHGIRGERPVHPPGRGRRARRGDRAGGPHRAHVDAHHRRRRVRAAAHPSSNRRRAASSSSSRSTSRAARRRCARSCRDAGGGAAAAVGRAACRAARRGRGRDGRPGLHGCRHGAAVTCASSPRRPTSTGAARCTAASSCAGSTRRPTCSPPSGPAAPQRRDLHRWRAVLPAAADRPRRRGRGSPAAHRAHLHAHRRARALGRPGDGPDGMELTTYCRTVFVAIDDERRAVPCPTWVPVNDEDRPDLGRPRRRAGRHP